MFDDRTDAGERLATRLRESGVEADLVLAIPRGGLPVGRAVADALDAPLDVAVASKVGAPGRPELALGAVAGDGSLWLNDDLVARLGVDDEYVDSARETEAEAARQKVEAYRDGSPLPDVAGKRVVLVDDGVATGATAFACLRMIREGGAERVVLAVPVVAASTLPRLREEADEVVTVEVPQSFGAVGYYYSDFEQVSDDEALAYLR